MSVKHPQFILAMDAAALAAYPHQYNAGFDPVHWAEQAQGHLVIRQRAQLENEPAFRQILPYVVFVKDTPGQERRFAAYRRGKGVGESKLMGNASIGFGGHIDLGDVRQENSVVLLGLTIANAAEREIKEEVDFFGATGGIVQLSLTVSLEDAQALILDNSNEVGRVHMGLVIFKQLPEPVATVGTRESELESLGLLTAQELLNTGDPLENWTRLILEHEAAVTA